MTWARRKVIAVGAALQRVAVMGLCGLGLGAAGLQ